MGYSKKWNRPSEAKVGQGCRSATTAGGNRGAICVLVGLTILIVVGTLWWLNTSDTKMPDKSLHEKETNTKATKGNMLKAKKTDTPKWQPIEERPVVSSRPMTPEEKRAAALARVEEAQKRNAKLPAAHEREAMVLKTASDQVLSMVADIAAGKDVPPLPIDKHFEKEFIASLKMPIEIADNDDERIKALKKNVIALRSELSERADNGESVSQILNEYQTRMAEDYKTRAELQQEARKILESGDREGARKFVDIMNLALQQMGIMEIEMPMTDEERKAWAEEYLKQREAEAKKRRGQ